LNYGVSLHDIQYLLSCSRRLYGELSKLKDLKLARRGLEAPRSSDHIGQDAQP